MSFLAPLFLLGAAAVALPFVFHLIRRSPRLKGVFSSLMFLDASAPKLTRRSRLEHLLLLLVRCAVIGLLALAFARPFLNRPMTEAASNHVASKTIVLLDASASMRRDGLWQAALDQTESLAAKLSPADQLAVFTFDEQLIPLVSFDDWTATASGDRPGLVRSRVARVEPGWAATALDHMVIQAVELLAEGDQPVADGVNQVVVLSDFQEGARTAGLQSHEWPKGASVRTVHLKPGQPGNASLQWLVEGNRDEEPIVRLRVHNSSDSRKEQFKVGWVLTNGMEFSGKPREIYVPAGQSRVISLPLDASSDLNTMVLLTGDDEPFDNRVFIIPPVRAQLKVLYFGEAAGNDSSGPLYFLQRAFRNTPMQEIEVVPVTGGETWPAGLADQCALIVATDALEDSVVKRMRKWVEFGGSILFAPRSTASAPTLARLMGIVQLPMTEFAPSDYGMLGEIDFRHPLFAPFADERFSDFTGIHFWKYRQIDESALPAARMLARFDNDDPALVEVQIGRGRLILLASGWFPSDSQLALSSKFVPFLFSLLEMGGRAQQPRSQFLVGNALPSITTNVGGASVLGPDGSVAALDAAVHSARRALQPGLYTIESSTSTNQFVVNLDPIESRTAPMPIDELERLGVPGPTAGHDSVQSTERLVTLHQAELEGRQKYWRWLIAATLALLVIETWLAGWTYRRSTQPERVRA